MSKLNNKIKVHFIGVGGAGMCVLCNLLLDKGFTVTGSDLKINSAINGLIEKGLVFYNQHNASQVELSDVVIVGSAISETNVELINAKRLKKAI